MNYFEDLNPYFVRQDPDAEVNPDGTLIPPKNPNPAAVPQIYFSPVDGSMSISGTYNVAICSIYSKRGSMFI